MENNNVKREVLEKSLEKLLPYMPENSELAVLEGEVFEIKSIALVEISYRKKFFGRWDIKINPIIALDDTWSVNVLWRWPYPIKEYYNLINDIVKVRDKIKVGVLEDERLFNCC